MAASTNRRLAGLRSCAGHLLVALAAACSGTEPAAGPASIEIHSSADSLFAVGPDGGVAHLVATVRDARGRELVGDSVVWDATPFSVTVTGPRSADFTMVAQNGVIDVAEVTVTARIGDVHASRAIVACPAQALAGKASGTMLVGRTDAAVSAVSAVIGGAYRAIAARPGWVSSNPAVVRVDGANLVAVSPGTALLTVSACGVSDTVTIAVATQGYAVTPIIPPGATTSTPVSMDEDGNVVGSSNAAGAYRYFRWNGGVFADLGDCSPVAVGAGRVLCPGNGPRIWENGVANVMDTITGTASAMAPSGRVAMRRFSHVIRWSAPGVFDTAHASLVDVDDMSSIGDIAGSVATLYPNPAIWRSDALLRLPYAMRAGTASAIDASGSVAVGGVEARIPALSTAALWRAGNGWQLQVLRGGVGVFHNDVTMYASDVNAAGVIVGSGSRGGFAWANGRLTLLTQVVGPAWNVTNAIRIDDTGRILATATNTATGFSGAVLLTPATTP